MGILQELTEKLAQDVLDAQEELGDDRFYEKVYAGNLCGRLMVALST